MFMLNELHTFNVWLYLKCDISLYKEYLNKSTGQEKVMGIGN